MQTIPSNLNAEELLRWYDSTWNKLTNGEMEQRLAGALKEALDDGEERRKELDEREAELDSYEEELSVREGNLE